MTSLESRIAMPTVFSRDEASYDKAFALELKKAEAKELALAQGRFNTYDAFSENLLKEEANQINYDLDHDRALKTNERIDRIAAQAEANAMNAKYEHTRNKIRKLAKNNFGKQFNYSRPNVLKHAFHAAAAIPFLASLMSAMPQPKPEPIITIEDVPVNDVNYSVANQGLLLYPVKNRDPYVNDIEGRRRLPENIKGTKNHPGNDLQADIGDTITAPATGRVTRADNYVVNVEQEGMKYQLRHLHPSVKVGDIVYGGQPVGVITTFSTSQRMPHLHLTVELDDKRVEPLCFFSPSVYENIKATINKFKATGLLFLSGKTEEEKLDRKCSLERAEWAYNVEK